MPQNGFHGLAGLGLAKAFTKQVPNAGALPFATWLVIGSMAPDIDMYPTAVAFLAKRTDLTYVIHRSLTHSIPLVLILLAIGALAAKPSLRWGLFGAAVGVASHILLDTLFWFTQIDLFWPFSHFSVANFDLPVVNLWGSTRMTALFVNIREAFEYCAFALFLFALRRISGDEMLTKWNRFAWIYFGVTLVTAFVLRERPDIQNVIVTAPYLLAMLPISWLAVWRNREALACWALNEQQAVTTS